jgi:hypothetical protein
MMSGIVTNLQILSTEMAYSEHISPSKLGQEILVPIRILPCHRVFLASVFSRYMQILGQYFVLLNYVLSIQTQRNSSFTDHLSTASKVRKIVSVLNYFSTKPWRRMGKRMY